MFYEKVPREIQVSRYQLILIRSNAIYDSKMATIGKSRNATTEIRMARWDMAIYLQESTDLKT